MWKDLGMDLETHDQLCQVLPTAFAVVDSIVRKVASQVSHVDLGDAVCLTGGLCDFPYVRERLEKVFGREVLTAPDARFAGALSPPASTRGMPGKGKICVEVVRMTEPGRLSDRKRRKVVFPPLPMTDTHFPVTRKSSKGLYIPAAPFPALPARFIMIHYKCYQNPIV